MLEIKINKALNSCAISICHFTTKWKQIQHFERFILLKGHIAPFMQWQEIRKMVILKSWDKKELQAHSLHFLRWVLQPQQPNPLSLTSLFSIFPWKLWNLIRKLTYSSMKYQQFLLAKIRKVWPVWSIQWSKVATHHSPIKRQIAIQIMCKFWSYSNFHWDDFLCSLLKKNAVHILQQF